MPVATIGMPHIGLGGHLPPAARLGAALAEAGHRVLAWAPERYRRHVEAPGVEFHAHEPARTERPFPSFVHFAAELAEATERCCPGLVEEMLAGGVELVVHDVHVPWARVAADFLGLPRIVTNPLFPDSPPSGARTTSPGGEVAHLAFFADPLARVERARHAVTSTWGIDPGDWRTMIRTAGETILSFTTEEIAGRSLPPGWQAIGPLLAPIPPAGRRPGRPLVYVAFGTFFNGRLEPFHAAIDALADAPVDVLVSTGGGDLAPAALGPLPAHIEVRSFVPSREVLTRAAVHVSHGGGGSLHEALAAGVPSVCLPQGSDQHAWAQRVEALGAGCVVEQRPEAIRTAVRRLLADERWRDRARVVGARLLEHPGRDVALAAVDRALGGAAAGDRQGAWQ